LNGAPLIAYTIISAIQADVFTEIVVSTDSPEIADIAQEWGAKVPKLRPEEFATDSSSDIEWVRHAVSELVSIPQHSVDKVSILRPTNPLRKSWILDENKHALPFLDQSSEAIPTFNRPTQTLQKLWVQNASLEIAKLSSIVRTQKISGDKVIGIELPSFEGFDINTQLDWDLLEFLVSRNPDLLPKL
jgi:CMP-N-acetylneuraminic acid synthetase